LVETTLSIAVLSIFCVLAYASMLASNRQATVNRLYTLAQEMARDQIDRLETVGPYNPQFPAPLGPQIPTDLVLDSVRGGPATQTLTLYADPASGKTIATATLTTSITDTNSLNTRAASVTVSYTFSGRSYTVRMNTLRTSDS
jgi:type II secretory pathway pseudopilin PulG